MSRTTSSADASLALWLQHLEDLHPKGQDGIELGLDQVRTVKDRLAQQQHCPLIIVGGTNGKGSTCAYLEAIYRFAGYRVGCYTSPHLLDYRERIRIDGAPVDAETLCAAFARVEHARAGSFALPIDAGAPVPAGAPSPTPAPPSSALTYFEFGTLAAWEVFTARQCELIILEVGLGGRLDAVNAYTPDCAIISSIDLDHTEWLGTTRDAIGFEKAGIYRPGTPAICADPKPPDSLLQHAHNIGADLRYLGRDFGYFGDKQQWTFWYQDPAQGLVRRSGLAPPGLRGACQLQNAAAALLAVESLKARLPVPMQAIRRGLIEPEIAGRFQVLAGRPAIVLDVAHNPQAGRALASNLDEMGFFTQNLAVVGMLHDKDIAGTLKPLAGKVALWLLSALDVARGASATTLAKIVQEEQLGGRVECYANPEEAFHSAVRQAGENDRILVFGSFHTVAAVLRRINNPPADPPADPLANPATDTPTAPPT